MDVSCFGTKLFIYSTYFESCMVATRGHARGKIWYNPYVICWYIHSKNTIYCFCVMNRFSDDQFSFSRIINPNQPFIKVSGNSTIALFRCLRPASLRALSLTNGLMIYNATYLNIQQLNCLCFFI